MFFSLRNSASEIGSGLANFGIFAKVANCLRNFAKLAKCL